MKILAGKILFCASDKTHIENFHIPYLKALKAMGFVIHVATKGKVSCEAVDASHDIPFSKSLCSSWNIAAFFKIKKLVRSEHYSMICTNSTLAGAIGRAACGHSVKTVHISHGYLFNDDKKLKSWLKLAVERGLKSRTDILITMNDIDFQIASRYHLAERIIKIDGMGVNFEKFPILVSKMSRVNKGFTFLCVGDFTKRKNQNMIIDAFKNVQELYPNTNLIFAGTGKRIYTCKRRAKYIENIKFVEYQPDINSYYRSADAIVSASFFEGLPFNVMESLLCGVPVIVSNIKGHVDLVKHGENGLLFDVNSKSALIDCMKISIDDGLSNKNINLDDRYSLEKVMPKLMNIYLKLLDDEGNF